MNIDEIINANMTVTDHLLRDAIHAVCVDVIMEAAREEREECAKLCLSLAYDDVASHFDEGYNNGLLAAAAAIRVREPQ